MTHTQTPGPEDLRDQIATLQCIVQRFAQAEHPSDFAITKQLLLERIGELEEEVRHTQPAAS